MNVNTVSLILASLLAVPVGQSLAQAPPEKWFLVKENLVNRQSSFMLRVAADKPDRVYGVDESMTVSVVAEKSCHLYLLYYGAANEVACLFPNRFQDDNFVPAGKRVRIPAADANFRFRATQPCGKEVLQVIGSLKPVEVLADHHLTKGLFTPLQEEDLKEMIAELKKGRQPDWAEARIDITTTDEPAVRRTSIEKPKRFAVCVGISQYKHGRVPPLRVAHSDAGRMAEALSAKCQVDEVTLLTNSEATLDAIEAAIFKGLVEKSKPGDELFIFFSCRGGRTADVNGDEPDGLDEYIVPHDGEPGRPESMLLDDVFARWIRELDGRRITLIMDNCYSGGTYKSIKGLGRTPSDSLPLDFFDGEIRRADDLGQGDTVVLAACRANQFAWEMPGENAAGVLTHFLLRSLDDPEADANGDGQLSVAEVHDSIKGPIEEFVRERFGADQNPVLLDNSDGTVCLVPEGEQLAKR